MANFSRLSSLLVHRMVKAKRSIIKKFWAKAKWTFWSCQWTIVSFAYSFCTTAAGMMGNKVECSGLGLGALGLLGANHQRKQLAREVFWVSCQFLFTTLVCMWMSYWLLSRFGAHAAPRQIAIVIEKSNFSLSLSRSCIILLANNNRWVLLFQQRGLIFRNASWICIDVVSNGCMSGKELIYKGRKT